MPKMQTLPQKALITKSMTRGFHARKLFFSIFMPFLTQFGSPTWVIQVPYNHRVQSEVPERLNISKII